MIKNKICKPCPHIEMNHLIRCAIRDAVLKALKSKPLIVHAGNSDFTCYEIDGEIYGEFRAIKKILGEYSWWNRDI